jgi:hypothetical protein
MAFTLQVHQPVKRGGQIAGFRVQPYARLCSDGDIIIVQGGELYSEGGAPYVGETPGWVIEQLTKMHPDNIKDLKAEKLLK